MSRVRLETDYITLSQLLKRVQAIATGGQAKVFLQEVPVLVNGEREQRRGRKLRPGDRVQVAGQVYVIEESAHHGD
ncbi:MULTISPECIES: S4 domain-containing protein YaaA [Alicyclobacillus]|uniref:S4 domain-containing protein YaaA n=1 Tax=Alicyclobacillus TaxID=29330 RepID=UPI000835F95C|nr:MULTISPECIES: S4 domain-containing protein YaaA [Alicyclobacillus]MCL6626403.1 S4 domain-containing protein YaaA [Alicyclobacillus shizuokensis]